MLYGLYMDPPDLEIRTAYSFLWPWPACFGACRVTQRSWWPSRGRRSSSMPYWSA